MPTRAHHPCATPGCPTIVANGSYCPTHERTRRVHSPEQARFYRSSFWTQLSKRIRRERPVCEICHAKPSKITDHVSGDWQDNRDEALMALCKDCNATKTAKQHRAKMGGT